jgi:hypothetical protein
MGLLETGPLEVRLPFYSPARRERDGIFRSLTRQGRQDFLLMVIGAQLSGAGQASHTARLSTDLHQLSRQKFTLRDDPGSAAEDRGVWATLGRKANYQTCVTLRSMWRI